MWPDVACDSAWLDDPAKHAQRKASNLPKKYVAEDWRGDLEIVPRLQLDGPPDTRRCLVWYYYDEDCDSHVRAPWLSQHAQDARLLRRMSRQEQISAVPGQHKAAPAAGTQVLHKALQPIRLLDTPCTPSTLRRQNRQPHSIAGRQNCSCRIQKSSLL